MTGDSIRKDARTKIDHDDKIEVYITGLANNLRGLTISSPIKVDPLDISVNGMKFESKYEFQIGIKLFLDITIYEKRQKIKANIQRIEQRAGYNQYAVVFLDIEPYFQSIIASFVQMKIVDEIRRIRNEKH